MIYDKIDMMRYGMIDMINMIGAFTTLINSVKQIIYDLIYMIYGLLYDIMRSTATLF